MLLLVLLLVLEVDWEIGELFGEGEVGRVRWG